MQIRVYRPTDRNAVRDLVERVLAEYGFPLSQVGSLDRDLEDAANADDRAAFWVAELDGEIVGTVAIRPKDERTCELKRLYLRADARGTGRGQALYDHAESFARRAGYERIWLDSSRRFRSAHRLYERNGFALLEYVDNEWEDAVFEKRLTTTASS